MKRMKRITIKKRRRLEGKTDYNVRLKLLSSGIPRLVVRKSNQYITAQIVDSKEAQDFVIISVNSKELSKLGWKFSKKSIPAAYLTCFLLAKKLAEKEKIKKAILDIGLQRSTKGSRLYACLKGALDGGLEIPHSTEMFPAENRIKGLHIGEETAKVFEEVKKKIMGEVK